MTVRSFLLSILFLVSATLSRGQYEILQANLDLSSVYNGFGVGLSVFDFDSDGFDDITICDSPWGIRAYRNTGNSTFELYHVFDEAGDAKCVIWVDYDNDDDYDLFYTREELYNRLFRNDGAVFTEVTELINPSLQSAKSTGCSWGDYDNDGYLDLYVCNYDSFNNRNWVYHNNGDGTFTEVSAILGIHNNYNASFQSVWTDINLDGWQDLYVVNDRLDTNRIYINIGGVFEDASVSMGLDVRLNSMSNSISDFDNDGDFDVYISNTPEDNYFMRNEGGGFINVADDLGLILNEWCWSGLWMDYDNDSDDDLHISTRDNPQYNERNPFFLNENGTFSKLNGYGLEGDEYQSTCSAKGDFNNDGKWDFAVNSQLPTCTNLWLNTQDETGHYIKLGLEGVVSNRDGVGSIIRCYHGGITNLLQTYCGENYMSQDSQYEIIGLGNDSIVDSLIVTWPSGWVDHYYNLEVDSFYGLLEGETFSAMITNANGGYLCPGSGMVELDAGDHISYMWQDGSQSRYLQVTTAGLYQVEVINSYGFVATAMFEVAPPVAIELSSSVSPINCSGGSDGAIELNIVQPVEELVWNTGSQNSSIANLAAGNYSCTITDALGCSFNYSFELTEPSPIELDAQWQPILCYGSATEVILSGAGGTGDIEFDWSIFNPQEIYAGSYTIAAHDSIGCVSTIDFDIPQPDSLVLTNTTALACYGQTIEAAYSISGGVSPHDLNWNDADENELSAGMYPLTIADANGCISTVNFEVNQSDSIQISWTVTDANSGDNGTISMIVEGGTSPYTFNWSNGAIGNPLENTGQGYYQCFVTDALGCYAVSENIQIIDSGVDENYAGGWSVYPNPTDNLVQLQNKNAMGNIGVSLYDVHGVNLLDLSLNSPNSRGSYQFETRHLPSGAYILSIHQSGISASRVLLILNH